MQALSYEQIVAQSKNAYNQHAEKWRKNCLEHSQFEQKSIEVFRNSGIGKVIVLAANGASLEKDMDAIKENKDVDILVCDKSLGHFIKNGIKPKFCLVADAVVNFEKYCEPFKDSLDETILIMNACGNPKWAKNAKWKDIYFFVSKDAIKSEEEFSKISGCKNIIAAGSNVSNAMVIFIVQCDDKNRKSFFNYDKILLTGFDYSFMPTGNYYAYDELGEGKKFYMAHISAQNSNGELCYTSNNLAFSAKWLLDYVNAFKLPVVQCSQNGLLPLNFNSTLDKHIKYNYDCGDSKLMIKLSEQKEKLIKEMESVLTDMRDLQYKHQLGFIKSL